MTRVACKDGDKVVGFYDINAFPGCNQIAVSNHAFIVPSERKKGYGTRFHKERLAVMEEMGYDYTLCTVKEANTPQLLILAAAGWEHLTTFPNSETGSVVQLWGRKLK